MEIVDWCLSIHGSQLKMVSRKWAGIFQCSPNVPLWPRLTWGPSKDSLAFSSARLQVAHIKKKKVVEQFTNWLRNKLIIITIVIIMLTSIVVIIMKLSVRWCKNFLLKTDKLLLDIELQMICQRSTPTKMQGIAWNWNSSRSTTELSSCSDFNELITRETEHKPLFFVFYFAVASMYVRCCYCRK